MKIVKHGTSFYFKCKSCGCEWIASRCECVVSETARHGKVYMYDCPECYQTTQGYLRENDKLNDKSCKQCEYFKERYNENEKRMIRECTKHGILLTTKLDTCCDFEQCGTVDHAT